MTGGVRKFAVSLLDRSDPRLSVRVGAQVTRILFSDNKDSNNVPQSTGVVILGKGTRADEVVEGDYIHLCAGPEGTARLLFLSGVGDKADPCWEDLKIPHQVHNTGVGKGYHDHPTVVDSFFSWTCKDRQQRGTLPGYQASAFTPQLQYSCVVSGGYAFLPHLRPYLPLFTHWMLPLLLELLRWILPGWNHNREAFTFGSVFVTASFPDHRAELRLRSKDPKAPLQVVGGGLSDRELNTLIEGMETAERVVDHMVRPQASREDTFAPSTSSPSSISLATTPPASPFVHFLLILLGLRAPRGRHATPSEANTTRSRFVKRALATLWHPAGGCCMGDGGALDARLRLRGTSNIHVCGAATFPQLPQANPQAQCYAMGYRLGEILTKNS
eukprot:CAMPEP_0196574122 /NCGR_PEP_ID=MMETSP1081-20130531/3896_1 /TAXON_ID=36882 /ORGANISM="Pyramimonas amylifera, Strain CCMP720" /LENGTH=385 /DNA_ID=CAMNT_0041892039 /DNA_START=53 /DNA_END=1210 /DNA_ORIENTATION=-